MAAVTPPPSPRRKKQRPDQPVPCVWTVGIFQSWSHLDFAPNTKLEIVGHSTLYELVDFLCKGPIRAQRTEDWDIDAHMWKLRFGVPLPLDPAADPPIPKHLLDVRADSHGAPWNKTTYVSGNGGGYTPLGDDGSEVVEDPEENPSTPFGDVFAVDVGPPVGARIEFSYDFGSTTRLYMLVLGKRNQDAPSRPAKASGKGRVRVGRSRKRKGEGGDDAEGKDGGGDADSQPEVDAGDDDNGDAANASFPRFVRPGNNPHDEAELAAVPASSAPVEMQLDTLFPNVSAAFMATLQVPPVRQ